MRTRTRFALVAVVLGAFALFGFAGSAHAGETEPVDEGTEETPGEGEGEHSEEGPEISHVGECVEEAVEAGTDPEECVEAPSPILPEANELIAGGLAFLIVFGLMVKFALPPLRQAMNDRTERIRTDLERAETAKTEAEQVLAQYNAQLADARNEANRIIEDARKTADALRADLEKRAQAEVAEMRQRAQADIEAAKAQAVADLQGEVARLAIGAAETIVEKSLDRETQVQLVESYISRVGAGR